MYRELKDGNLRCRDCSEWFPIESFQHHIGKDGKRRPGSYCKKCKRFRAKKDSAKFRYGLSLEEFLRLTLDYPVCAICGASQVFVDHNHTTGKVRGRLCRNCNTGLGMFLESPELLSHAIKYLTDHKPE